MALQLEQWFIHAVSDNVTHLAQQKQSKVMGAVRMATGVVGKTHPFNRIGSLSLAEVTTRDGDTQYLNPPQSKRRAILRDFVGYVLIDDFDQVKTLTSPQSEFSLTLARALNRTYDDLTIGICTSAITLGRWDVPAVMASYAAMLALLAVVGWRGGLAWPFYAGLGVAAAMMAWHWRLIRDRSREGCFKAFLHNNWVGGAIFSGIALSFVEWS